MSLLYSYVYKIEQPDTYNIMNGMSILKCNVHVEVSSFVMETAFHKDERRNTIRVKSAGSVF